MVEKSKYVKFVSEVLEDVYYDIKQIKSDCKNDDILFNSQINKFVRNSPFKEIVSKEKKEDTLICFKEMKKFLKGQIKEIESLYDEKEDEDFVYGMTEYFQKSQLKNYFREREEFSLLVEELLDEKYSFVGKFLNGENAEQDKDVRKLMQRILKNSNEIDFIEKGALEASPVLKTFACHILAKEREKARICGDSKRIKEIEGIKRQLLESDKELKEDFKGGEEYLNKRIVDAIAEDVMSV